MILDRDIKYLKGVGDTRAKLLASELEITTVRDLLFFFPHRHIDRTKFYKIADFAGLNLPALQVKGRFISFRKEGEGSKQRLIGVFTDGNRMMDVLWFKGIQNIERMYLPGKDYVLFGRPTLFREQYNMVHPEVEEFNPDRPQEGLRGVYHLTETLRKRGFTQRFFQTVIRNIFELLASSPDELKEILPSGILEKHRLLPVAQAVRALHFPSDMMELQRATTRMKFEELYFLELHILHSAGQRRQGVRGAVFSKIGPYFNDFYEKVIPFDLTGAQKRVLREIREDMRRGRQMNRLLQGDVGSGKTMVAFMTMLMAVDNGFQAALMAPTEILATQHYESLSEWGEKLGIRVELLTGSTRVRKRREIAEGLTSGDISILVGTHALLEEKVEFAALGVAVIDEQHRFGVAQRAKMWGKAEIPPHVLVMTATPIPRTLAMTVYGDLDVSVIDELPPGRKPVETYLKYDENRMEVNRLILRELKDGRQVYIVYPLVKENEKLDLKSVEEGFLRIQNLFPDYRVCCVHGQLKPDEKDRAMQRFVSGEARIMVATTVIEVGVNVPNASVMVIENSERFGLSQLHQLRGRVGRGADKSFCILMSHSKIGRDTRRRLELMTETTDGFMISEADLHMRGPGDLEGTQQSGLPIKLTIANLARDGQYVELARREAEATIEGAAAGKIPAGELSVLAAELFRRFARTTDWSSIS